MSSELSFKMDLWIEKQYNIILEGKHGVGKTELIKQKFNEHNLNWLYFSAATMDPWVDFIGIPREKKENGIEFTELVRPRYLAEDSIDAIFLDEYNRAPKKIRNATMELIQFKSINGKKFNRLKFIWVAINPNDDNDEYDIETLDEAQKDRFQIYYRVPYAVSNEYFHSKYGEMGIIASKWWNSLEDAKKKLISPRRLDYCLDYYNSNGDLGDVVHPEINYHSLISQLENGLYADKITTIFNTKDDKAAIAAFKSENFYNATINIILKNSSMMEYFVDKIPKEKVIINMLENYPFTIAATNKLSFIDFKDSINEIVRGDSDNYKINPKILDAITRWATKEGVADCISTLTKNSLSVDSLMNIVTNIEHTNSSMRRKVLGVIKESLLTYDAEKTKFESLKAAVMVYLVISQYPAILNEYLVVIEGMEISSKAELLQLCQRILDEYKLSYINFEKEFNKFFNG